MAVNRLLCGFSGSIKRSDFFPIRESLILLKNKPIWKERYQDFIGDMVYDRTSAFEYESAIDIIEHISAGVIDIL